MAADLFEMRADERCSECGETGRWLPCQTWPDSREAVICDCGRVESRCDGCCHWVHSDSLRPIEDDGMFCDECAFHADLERTVDLADHLADLAKEG